MNSKVCAVVLAAGEGKRMKSELPKVLSEVLFKPMIDWVIDAAFAAGIPSVCTVVGRGAELVTSHIESSYGNGSIGLTFRTQRERLGTAHAVAQASDFLSEMSGGHTLILCGDAPFISPDDIKRSLVSHTDSGNAVTVITANIEDPAGYGRIVRSGESLAAIVEDKEAGAAERLIKEVNSGAYWFQTDVLLEVLHHIGNRNSKGEYYLTDAVELILKAGRKAGAFVASPDSVLGANDRKALALLNEIARNRQIDLHLDNGVDLFFRDGVIITPGVVIGEGTKILPGTVLKGQTIIGKNCTIGPNSWVEDCTIGDGTVINSSQCRESTVGAGVRMGPFSQLRPHCTVADFVKIGNFVEVKNSALGNKTSIAHLTYVGDSDVGERVNFGCGCVTVNYDGVNKARCTVGDGAFIGCNTNLIAPVTVGAGAYTAAGSTITEDVPDGALAIGRVRSEVKPGWAARKMKKGKH